jgi:dihydromethanopterin reductase (acceptor)
MLRLSCGKTQRLYAILDGAAGKKTNGGQSMGEKGIAWAITGAGHALEECVEVLVGYKKVDVFLSRAAEEVLRMYGLRKRIQVPEVRIYRETRASAPEVSRFFAGSYSALVIAPATSNSVAKFVHGISDTLVTNLFAQAGKSRVPVIVYPTDMRPEMDTLGPHREPVKVYPRHVDLQNTAKLRNFSAVHVVGGREELKQCIDAYL